MTKTLPSVFTFLAFMAVLCLISAKLVSSADCKGCTPLDELTFDKMIDHFEVSLIKFDKAYPYGDKHEEFTKVAAEAAAVQNLLVGEVGIKDYGDKDNEALGKRFNVEKDKYPELFLFVKDSNGKLNEYKFESETFDAKEIKSFVSQHSNVYLTLVGCIKEFDILAEKFSNAEDKETKETILKEATKAAESVDEKLKKNAQTYVAIMKKMTGDSAADNFVSSEIERVKKILEGKITDKKKKEFMDKQNILASFNKKEETKKEKAKEEAENEEKKEEKKEEL